MRVVDQMRRALAEPIGAPKMSRYERDQSGPPEEMVWCGDWAKAVAELAARHGPRTRVAVYPYATIQLQA